MNDLTGICQQVWTTTDVNSKRALLKQAVSSFKYKAKQQEFINEINKADGKRCDFLASSLILNNGDKVVELLKR